MDSLKPHRSRSEIARQFCISEQTVKHLVTNIFFKTGASSRLELTLFAIEHGLVETPPLPIGNCQAILHQRTDSQASCHEHLLQDRRFQQARADIVCN